MSRHELEEQRDFLLASIRDLDAELAAGDIEPDDHRNLREDYTARAAAILRQLESPGLAGASTLAVAAAAPPAGRGRRLLVAGGLAAVAVVAGLAMASSAGERLPGDPLSGAIDQGVSDKLIRAQRLIGAGKASEAVALYDEILREDPDQVEALAYRGWIVHLAGLSEKGLEYLDRAVAVDPGYPDAHFFRGMVLWRFKGDPAGAAAEFRLFLANNPPPEMVGLVESNLQRALAEAEGGAASTSTSTTVAP